VVFTINADAPPPPPPPVVVKRADPSPVMPSRTVDTVRAAGRVTVWLLVIAGWEEVITVCRSWPDELNGLNGANYTVVFTINADAPPPPPPPVVVKRADPSPVMLASPPGFCHLPSDPPTDAASANPAAYRHECSSPVTINADAPPPPPPPVVVKRADPSPVMPSRTVTAAADTVRAAGRVTVWLLVIAGWEEVITVCRSWPDEVKQQNGANYTVVFTINADAPPPPPPPVVVKRADHRPGFAIFRQIHQQTQRLRILRRTGTNALHQVAAAKLRWQNPGGEATERGELHGGLYHQRRRAAAAATSCDPPTDAASANPAAYRHECSSPGCCR
jgi:hypothetical protein